MLLQYVKVLTILLATLASQAETIEAYSEEENFAFINKILDHLNNEIECKLPSYEETDELQKSFDELEAIYKDSLTNKLNSDQLLLRKTLLDQWPSFQERMTSAVVIRSAKLRSFICKVESYQRAKSGHSICADIPIVSNKKLSDHVFEKNPLVRYIKHLDTNEVIDPEPEGEAQTTGVQMIKTPVDEESIPNEISPQGTNADELDGTTTEVERHDPIIDISNIQLSDEEDVRIISGNTVITLKFNNGAATTQAPVQTSSVEADSSETIEAGSAESDDSSKSPSELEAENQSKIVQESTPSEAGSEEQMTTEASSSQEETSDSDSESTTSAALVDETTTAEEITTTTEPTTTTEAEVIEPVTPAKPEPIFDENGAEYVNEAKDDQDLSRLVKVPSTKYDFLVAHTTLVWPDEQQNPPSEGEIVEELSEDYFKVSQAWTKFLRDPELACSQQPPAGYRKRRKDFYEQWARDRWLDSIDDYFGWNIVDRPLSFPKADQWVNLVDGRLLKIKVNKRPYTNAKDKVKSMFNQMTGRKQQCRKRELLKM